MNYEIIKNEKLLLEFIDWLPELQTNECYYLCLFARSKYAKNEDGTNKFAHIKTDKNQLKRFTVHNKKLMFNKIRQLEVKFGTYRTKDDEAVPQESLALYISPNPRDQKKAMLHCMKKFCDIIETQGSGFNIHSEAISAIQKSCSRKVYYDFDFDNKTVDDLKDTIEQFINPSACNYLVTRGGFHLLIELNTIENIYTKSWYNNIVKLDADIKGDNLIPVIGCTQGEFIPYFKSKQIKEIIK